MFGNIVAEADFRPEFGETLSSFRPFKWAVRATLQLLSRDALCRATARQPNDRCVSTTQSR